MLTITELNDRIELIARQYVRDKRNILRIGLLISNLKTYGFGTKIPVLSNNNWRKFKRELLKVEPSFTKLGIPLPTDVQEAIQYYSS